MLLLPYVHTYAGDMGKTELLEFAEQKSAEIRKFNQKRKEVSVCAFGPAIVSPVCEPTLRAEPLVFPVRHGHGCD
jgi:hypothetical protein